MRGLLLCCLVALAACQEVRYNVSFNPKKVYEYKYAGMVDFGLGMPDLAESGVRMTCTIKITGLSTQTFTLQVSDLSFKEVNGVPGKEDPSPSAKLTERIAAQLVKPFVFDHVNGHVGDIRASMEVSHTVVNIVRGILGLTHLTVKTTQSIYELEEVGIHGMCQSNYAIEGIAEGRDATITQVVDVTNCREKAAMYKGMATAVLDKLSKQRGESVISTVRYVYNVKPTPEGGLITSAHGLERQHFSPFNVKGGSFKMQAMKEIVLVHVTDSQRAVTFGQMESRGNIVYKFACTDDNIPIMMQNLQDPVPKAIELIKRLAQANIDKVDSATTEEAMKLYQLLRVTPFEGLESMWKQFEKTNAEQRRWFLDMITEVNDARILKFLEARLRAEEVTVNEAVQSLVVAIDHLQALPELVDVAKRFFEIPFVKFNSYVWQTVVLSYGSLVYKHCAYYTPCPVTAVQPLLDLALDSLRRHNETDMVLALKALGNAGHPGSIKTIMRFLPGVAASPVDLPVRVQSAAVQAMRLLAARDPHSVQDISMTLFLQRNLPSELRMLALTILFDTKPSMALVSTVTFHLQEDTDTHVVSFAYSYLQSLARSRTPDNQLLSTACSLAVKILAPKYGRLSYCYSKAGRLDWFNENFLIGAASEVFMMRNANSIFPTEIMARSKLYAIGRIVQLMELGIRADGLKDLLSASIPGFKGDFSFKDFDAIFRVLQNCETLPNDKPVLTAYSRVSGQEWFFTDISKELFRNIIMAIRPSAGKESPLWAVIEKLQNTFSWRWTKPFLNFEVRYLQATTLGLPLEISKYYHAVTGLAVEARTSFNPPLTGQLGQLLTSNISLETQGFAGFTKDLWVFYGINTDLFQCGYEFKSKIAVSLPWKLDAKINVGQKRFELDFPACTKEIELVSVRSNVYAISRNVEEPASAKITPIMLDTVTANAAPTAEQTETPNLWLPQAKICTENSIYGVGVCAEAELKRQYYHQEYPLYYFLGYTHMALKVTPAHAIRPVEKIHFELNAGTSKQPVDVQQLLATLRKLSKEAAEQVSSGPTSAKQPHSNGAGIEIEALNSTSEALLNIKAFALSQNQKLEGYDASVYYSPAAATKNAQLIVSHVGEETNWKMCVDSSVNVQTGANATVQWGAECQSYDMSMTAAASFPPGAKPTLNAKVHWNKIPDDMAEMGARIESYVPGVALLFGFYQQQERNAKQEVSASVVACSSDSVDVTMKLPKYTVYRQAIPLPVLPANFEEFHHNIRNETLDMFGQA